MPKLYIMKGLPGSGKTTLALQILAKEPNTIRFNRDELRTMMLGPDWKWSRDKEKFIKSTELASTIVALETGRNVILDDTNVLGDGTNYWISRVMQHVKPGIDVDVVIHDLSTENVWNCVARDSLRIGRAQVGVGVIMRMALFGKLLDFSKHERIAIVDVDGTVANCDHRLNYLEEKPKNYYEFFTRVGDDTPHQHVVDAVKRLRQTGHTIIVVSGRPHTLAEDWKCRVGNNTYDWLFFKGIWPDYLFMRQSGDYRLDSVVKREIFDAMLKCGLDHKSVKIALDDRESICEVWREAELPLVKVDHDQVVEVSPKMDLELLTELGIPLNLIS